MAKFVSGNDLNAQLSNILKEAKEQLYLISPYIKLHHRDKDELQKKINVPELKIIVVFGKNENDLKRSLNQEDLLFFTQLPNIKICYQPRLHAKYYANESAGLITSMNLYDYSQNNNIESGVLTKSSFFGLDELTGSIDRDAVNYFTDVVNQSEVIFENQPNFQKAYMGLSKKYINSTVTVNKLEQLFGLKLKEESSKLTTYDKTPPATHQIENKPIEEVKATSKTSTTEKDHSKSKYYSISAIAKEIGISPKDLFNAFENGGLMKNNGSGWSLTKEGVRHGGQMKSSQYGEYVAWPEEYIPELRKALKR